MNLKTLVLLLLLVGCQDYAKPFSESETRHGCSDRISETEKHLERYLNGIALTKCLSKDFKGVEAIRDTFYCFSKEISTRTDCNDKPVATNCEEYFRCLN